LRNIEKALSRLNVDWEQTKINERYEITLKDTFESIHSNLEFIHSVLRNNESALDVTNYELKEVDFLNFIKGYVKRIKSAERSNINIILDIHPDIKIQLNNKVVLKANTELLEIAMNAIVENAYMHAFTDHSKKYKLELRVSLFVAPSVKDKSNDEAWEALKPLTKLGISLGELKGDVDVTEDIPYLGIKKGTYNIQRFFYWNIMKAFYRPDFNLEEMNHINFDWFRPLNCFRHTEEELINFCEDAGLKIEHFNKQEAGFTVVARKK